MGPVPSPEASTTGAFSRSEPNQATGHPVPAGGGAVAAGVVVVSPGPVVVSISVLLGPSRSGVRVAQAGVTSRVVLRRNAQTTTRPASTVSGVPIAILAIASQPVESMT